MLDDLRDQAEEASTYDGNVDLDFEEALPYSPRRNFLSMTPPQRFVIAIMLLMMTCISGALVLLVTEKITLPFF